MCNSSLQMTEPTHWAGQAHCQPSTLPYVPTVPPPRVGTTMGHLQGTGCGLAARGGVDIGPRPSVPCAYMLKSLVPEGSCFTAFQHPWFCFGRTLLNCLIRSFQLPVMLVFPGRLHELEGDLGALEAGLPWQAITDLGTLVSNLSYLS